MVLPTREKLILLELSRNTFRSANDFVKKFSRKFSIPESSVWFSLRKLRKFGLVDYGGFIAITNEGERSIKKSYLRTP